MKKPIFITILIFLTFHVLAQTGVPYIFNFKKSEYRAAGQNWAVGSDEHGRVYIGNSRGLLQYNGTYWQLLPLPKGEYVRSIHMTDNGRIYIGSFEEFGFFSRDRFGKLTYTSLSDSVKNYTFHNDQIWNISSINDTVYFRSLSSYFVYNGKEVQAVSNPFILLYMQSLDGTLYAFKQGAGLGIIEQNNFNLLLPSTAINNSEVIAVLPYSSQEKLLVTNKGGLFIFNGRSCHSWKKEVNEQIRPESINKAIMTKDSIYILGTLTNGVFAFDRQGQLQWHVNTSNGLQNNTVLGLHCDNSNNLWVALDNGISYIRSNSYTRFIKPFKRDIGSVLSACFHKGYLYLATNQGLFFCRENGKTFDAIPFPGMSTQALELAVFDEQLLCGHNSGTYEITGEQLTKLSNVSGGTNLQKAIIHQQEVLIQSSYTYLNIYRKDALGRWRFSHSIPNFLQPIRNIEIDSQGCIWASHLYKGMFCLQLSSDLKTAEKIEYYPQIGEKTGKGLIDIFKIHGRVVFNNGEQYYTYDDLHKEIIPHHLLNKHINKVKGIRKAIAIDNETYWCVRDDEFTRIHFINDSIVKQKVLHFSLFRSDLPDYDENIVKNPDGKLIFCLNNGISIVDSELEVYPSPAQSGIRFEAIEIFSNENNVTPLEINPKEIPVISYTNNNITFRVSPKYFMGGNMMQFRFALQGPDNDLSKFTDEAEKTYNRLHWGNYRLVVSGYDSHGNKEEDITYSFKIAPPFYASTQAFILYTLLMVLFFFLLYILIHKYLQKSKAKIAHEQEKLRKEESERQEKEIIKLRNQNLETELTFKGKELASSAMMLINKNEVLYEIKAELEVQKEKLGVHYPNKYYSKIVTLIEENLSSEDDWKIFQANFDLIHESFFRNLKSQYPDLTPNDLKICSLLRLNLTTKDVANFLGISPRGVEIARYRLRKKLHLPTDKNLVDFLIEFK